MSALKLFEIIVSVTTEHGGKCGFFPSYHATMCFFRKPRAISGTYIIHIIYIYILYDRNFGKCRRDLHCNDLGMNNDVVTFLWGIRVE